MKSKLLLFLIIFTAVIRWQSWFVPLNRDEGGYAYVASQLSTPGFVMYRDAFEHKPPLIDLLYWFSFRLFGQSDFAIHTFAFMFSVLTSFVFFVLVNGITHSKRVSYLCTSLLIIFSNTFFLSGNGSNVEIFLSPLLLIAYWCLIRKKAFWSGLILGLAIVLKPVAIANLAAAYLFLDFSRSEFLKSRIRLTLGWLIPVLVLITYEVSTGAFGDFFKAVFGFNLFYVQYGVERLPYNDNLFRFLVFPDPVLLTIVVGTGLLVWFNRSKLKVLWKPIFWAIAIIAGAKILSREADHYYIPLLPALGLILVQLRGVRVVRLMTIAFCLYLVLQVSFLLYAPKKALLLALGTEQLQRYDAKEIGSIAKRIALSGDVAHVSLVAEPELLFYAGLPSANRYFNTFAIDFYPEGRQTIIETLSKKPIVVMAYPGIIIGLEDKLLQMGYKKDNHAYFAPVYWREDAAEKLGL